MTEPARKPGTFVKGDPRCHRKGRPKKLAELRDLGLEIAHEVAMNKGEPLTHNGHKVTVIEAVLRDLAKRNPELFLSYVYGKVPNEVRIQLSLSNLENMPTEELERIAAHGIPVSDWPAKVDK